MHANEGIIQSGGSIDADVLVVGRGARAIQRVEATAAAIGDQNDVATRLRELTALLSSNAAQLDRPDEVLAATCGSPTSSRGPSRAGRRWTRCWTGSSAPRRASRRRRRHHRRPNRNRPVRDAVAPPREIPARPRLSVGAFVLAIMAVALLAAIVLLTAGHAGSCRAQRVARRPPSRRGRLRRRRQGSRRRRRSLTQSRCARPCSPSCVGRCAPTTPRTWGRFAASLRTTSCASVLTDTTGAQAGAHYEISFAQAPVATGPSDSVCRSSTTTS